MMRRRTFAAGMAAMMASPFAAEAQQVGKVPRVGFRANTRSQARAAAGARASSLPAYPRRVADSHDPDRPWDDEAWPLVRQEFVKALALRSRLPKVGWWN